MSYDLAKRAVACPDWRWLPGMRGVDYNSRKWRRVGDSWVGEGHAVRTCRGEMLPDLTDPATLVCLLALVAEAHCVTLFDVHVVGAATGGASVWVVRLGESSERLSDGPNKLAALVAALEAAP